MPMAILCLQKLTTLNEVTAAKTNACTAPGNTAGKTRMNKKKNKYLYLHQNQAIAL
jgi:hypothetical protein